MHSEGFSALGLQEMAAYCLKDRKTQIDLQTPALRQKSLGADPLCRSKVVLGLLASPDHTLRNENETVNSGIEEVPSPLNSLEGDDANSSPPPFKSVLRLRCSRHWHNEDARSLRINHHARPHTQLRKTERIHNRVVETQSPRPEAV